MKQQIIVLATDFKPMDGGVAEYLHQLWNHAAQFCPVTVMSTVQPGAKKWDHAYQLEILPPTPKRRLGNRFGDGFPPVRKLNTAIYFIKLKRYAREVLSKFKKNENLQVFIGIWDVESHFWRLELQRRNIPYFLHVYGQESLTPMYGRLPRWRKNDFEKARKLIAITQATAELVKERLGRNLPIEIVYPGVEKQGGKLPSLERMEKLKNELFNHEGPFLLTVCRLVARKGVDLVLQSLSELIGEFPGIQYTVVGDGPERSRLEELTGQLKLRNHVKFFGHVDEVDRQAFYQLCDLFVMPNRLMGGRDWEGFGIVFLEAALAGKPSIGGNNGGVPEAIQNGVTGLLVDPEKPGELTLALRKLLKDKNLRERMGSMAQKRACENFDWKFIAKRFLEEQIK